MKVTRASDGKMIDVGRNEPCLCGSGRKLKRCCLPKMQAAQRERMSSMENNGELTNTFRDEAAKQEKTPLEIETEAVGEDEMMRRDSFVMMRHLQAQHALKAGDVVHVTDAIKSHIEFLAEMDALPLSEAREGIMQITTKQLKELEKVLLGCSLARSNVVTLAALEFMAGMVKSTIGQTPLQEELAEEDETYPGLAKEDDDLDDDDDDDTTPEALREEI